MSLVSLPVGKKGQGLFSQKAVPKDGVILESQGGVLMSPEGTIEPWLTEMGMARFLNHACSPTCALEIVDKEGQPPKVMVARLELEWRDWKNIFL